MRTNEFLAELSNDKLAKYKTAAAADASKADSEGNFKKGDKRFKGINTATKKQFDNDAKKVEETHSLKGTMITETRTYKLWENAGRKLMEAEMTADQIQQIFQKVQDIETAGGTNRSMIGKTKDAMGAVGDAWEELKGKVQNSGPIKNMDAYYDQAAEKLKQATGGDQGVMQYVQKYRDFAKKHPVSQSLIYAALIAAAGVSGVGAGGAAALGLFKMVDKLLQGEKFSSSAYAGAKTGGMAYGASQIGQYFKGGDAVGNSGPHPRGDVTGTTASAPATPTAPAVGTDTASTTASSAAEQYTKIGGQRFIPGEPLSRVQMAAVDMSKSMGNPVKPAVQQAYDMAVKAGVGAAKPLSESQIYRLIGRIVNEHKKQVDEGIMDWAKTKGQNLTTKITADKLLQAWKKAGSPTDSDQVADIMVKAGVPSETLNNVYTNFKLPAAKPAPAQPKQGLLGRMAGGVGDAIGSVRGTYAGMKDAYGGGKMTGYDASRANQAMQHVGHTGEVNPETRASAPQATGNATTPSNAPASGIGAGMSAAGGTRGYAPSSGAASGGAGQAAAPSSGPSSFRTVDDAKDAIDDVLDGLNSLKRRNRTAAVSYGAKEFSKLAQQSQQPAAPGNTKQPKPANLRVSGGNPGAPTPDEQANLQRRIDQASGNQTMDEEKQRMDPKCWTGYKKQGTKMKGDTRVNNCVPIKESAILSGVHQVDEGWKSALGSAALAGAMALGGAAHGRVTPDQDPGVNRLTGKPVATQVAQDDEKPAAKASSGYSAEYLQSVIDGKHPRPMLSVEKAKQLLQQQGQQ
jgi:hypothetical protein